MSKYFFALSLLISIGCMQGMESKNSHDDYSLPSCNSYQNSSSESESSGEYEFSQEGEMKGVPLFTDFLLRIANLTVAKNYVNSVEAIQEKKVKSHDHKWRRVFKDGGLVKCQKEFDDLKLYKQFSDIMENGQKTFNAQEEFIHIPTVKATSEEEEISGEFIRLKTDPVSETDVWTHYSQSPFVYKLKVGTEAVDAYIKQKKEKRINLIKVRQQNKQHSSGFSFVGINVEKGGNPFSGLRGMNPLSGFGEDSGLEEAIMKKALLESLLEKLEKAKKEKEEEN